MVSCPSGMRPSHRVRAVAAHDLCVQKFNIRTLPTRSAITSPTERGRNDVSTSSMYLGRASLLSQRPLRKIRTVCDFSAHMQFCIDEELKNTKLQEPIPAAPNSNFENEWKIPRSSTLSDHPAYRTFLSDQDECDTNCPTYEDSAAQNYENISYLGEKSHKFKTLLSSVEISLWEDFAYLRLTEPSLLINNKIGNLQSAKPSSDISLTM
jgi:hypothetical protein